MNTVWEERHSKSWCIVIFVCTKCVVWDCCEHHSYTFLLRCCWWWSLHSCPVVTAFSILKHFVSSVAALDNVMCRGQSKSEEKSLLPPCKGACDVWVVQLYPLTLCSLCGEVDRYRCFRGVYSLHFLQCVSVLFGRLVPTFISQVVM